MFDPVLQLLLRSSQSKRRRTFLEDKRQIFTQRIQPKLEHMFHKRPKKCSSADQVTPLISPAASQPDKNKVIETYSTPSKASPCKKMSIKLDKHEPEWSCWHYYKRQRKPSIATCRLCGWSIGIGAGLSDLLLADHMQNAHPHQHSNRLQAEALQRLRQLTAQMVAPTFSVAVDRELQCLSIEVDNLSNELVQIPLQLPSYATTNNNDHLPLDESIVCCQLDNLLNELQIPKCRVRFSETKQ